MVYNYLSGLYDYGLWFMVYNYLIGVDDLFEHCKSTFLITSSVMEQKGESQSGCFKKTKQTKFFEKRTFLTP